MPQQSFNCVALDLDGTLLNSQHKVSPETKRVLQLLHTSNIALIIATGRSGGSVHDVARELDLKTEIPLVCVNGTVGKRIPSYGSSVTVAADKVGTEVGISGAFAQSSEKIFYTPVSRVATLKTFALAKRLGFCVQFYANDKIYANPVSALDFEAVEKYSVMTGTKQVLVEDDFAEVLAQGLPSKLLIMCGEQSVATVASLAREELGLTCHLIHGTPSFFVEVLDKKANKGNGKSIVALIHQFLVSRCQTCEG